MKTRCRDVGARYFHNRKNEKYPIENDGEIK